MSDLKFGPIWLRNLSREGSAGATGGAGRGGGAAAGSSRGPGPARNPAPQPGTSRQAQQGSKYKLAEHRYGREEMLALYEDAVAPTRMSGVEALYVSNRQRPLALSTDSAEDDPRDRNSMGLHRNLAGPGPGLQNMERFGAPRGMDSNRGRPRQHQPFNLSGNGRGAIHRDDTQYYSETPAPGLTRSWSSGAHAVARNADNTDYNQNRTYYKSQSRWTESNWRRPSNSGRPFADDEPTSGLRRLQPLGRQRHSLDKRDVKMERPTSWTTNRRSWGGEQQFSDEYLPEWALEGNEASGGTFDSSGAFHGVDSPVQRPAEQHFGLARSNTQGSINIRSRPHEEENATSAEGSQTWWNHHKSMGAEPKFDATSIPFKKPPPTPTDNTATQKCETPDKTFDIPSAMAANKNTPRSANKDSKKKKTVTFDTTEDNYHKASSALRKLCDQEQVTRDEAEKGGESFSSVMIKPDNSLRQRHQHMMPAAVEQSAYTAVRSETPKLKESEPEKQAVRARDSSGARPVQVNPVAAPKEPSMYTPFSSRMPNPSLDGNASNFASTSLDIGPPGQTYTSAASEPHQNTDNATLKALALKLAKDLETWFYEDPQKKLQGPFTPYEMLQWFQAGFFQSDLMIRRNCDKHMRPLGSYGDVPPFAECYTDVMGTMARESLRMDFNEPPMGVEQHPGRAVMEGRRLLLPPPPPPPAIQMLQVPVSTAQQMHSEQVQMSAARGQAPAQVRVTRGPPTNVAMQQNIYHSGGRPVPFPREMIMEQAAYSAPLHMQERGQQASAVPSYRANYGLDMPHNLPVSTPPPVFSNNSYLMDQIMQPLLPADSLWGQGANYGWSQLPHMMMPPSEFQWAANTPPMPAELPMPEMKAPRHMPTQLEMQTKLLQSMLAHASLLENGMMPVEMRDQADIPLPANQLTNVPLPKGPKPAVKPPSPADKIPKVEKKSESTPPLPPMPPMPIQPPAPVATKAAKVASQPATAPSVEKAAKTKETKKNKGKINDNDKNKGKINDGDKNKGKIHDGDKNKGKIHDGEKKKKETKNEMKIEEVPGFVKVKKEDKKKEDKKIAITEIPAATKASQRAILEKKRHNEPKARPQVEQENVKKEEAAGMSFDEDECDLLDQLELKYEESESQLEKAPQSAKKAPWCASPGTAADAERLTLADIQRLEREKKLVSMKEQQHMVQLIAQQQRAVLQREQEINQSGYNWTHKAAKNNSENVQSLAEIQEETRRRQVMSTLEEQAASCAIVSVSPPANNAGNTNASAPWSSTPASNSPAASAFFAGFWESAPRSDSKNTAEPPRTTAVKPRAPSASPTPDQQFHQWCSSVLTPFASQIDVPVFVGFLKEIDSPYEIREYIKCYLGETKESTEFARNFLEKRSKLLRSASASHLDDLSSPAPAKNPSSLSNSDYQEVKGKAKKVKKNKMLKIDARILGFSVTAAEDRINVGDIDSV